MSWLIIVTGQPAAGKSTLAKWLGQRLDMPVLSKDGIKEILFEELGWRDREWSKRLGRASVEVMYACAQSLLEANQSVILDNAFHPELASATLKTLQKRYGCKMLQVICAARSDVLFERFKQRAESGLRHAGHVDAQCLDEFRASLAQGRALRLDLDGDWLEVDTTDFSAVPYEAILGQIESIFVRT